MPHGMARTSRRGAMTGVLAVAVFALMARAETPHPLPGIEFVLEATVEIGPLQAPGATPYGQRFRIPITGGHFEGPRIKGSVLPGGADWQLRRADGSTTFDADYMIQAYDGTLIHVHNRAIAVGAPDFYLRTAPVFEAPIGPHDWLNKAIFVGTVEVLPGNKAVCIRVFKVT